VDQDKFLGQNGRALGGNVTRVSTLSAVLCAVLSVVSLTIVHARQSAPAASPPKPLIPAAANSIASNPDAFVGQNVTIMAAVDRIVSPTSFTVDQDTKTSGVADVLVLVDVLNAPLSLNSYVTVIGEVVRHEGRPAIRATAVINGAMVNVAKRLLPPMTAEEESFDAIMKRINPAFSSVRQAVTAAAGESARSSAATLTQGFTETEAFWTKRDKADAAKWALDARTQAAALEKAIAAGKWDEAKTAITALQQSCSACHAKYRERQDDGSYRIRMGN
jgi:cytochrome c556